eukprot:258031_1
MANNEANLRQMVYAESEINAYDTIVSSVKTQDNFNFDSRSNRSVSDSQSLVSYATSNYSEEHHESRKKSSHKNKQIQKLLPQNNDKHRASAKYQGSGNQLPPKFTKLGTRVSTTSVTTINTVSSVNTISSNGKMKDSFARQIILDSKTHANANATAPWKQPKKINNYGGLSKKLNNPKIRESMEMDLNASMQSTGSSGVPLARLSEIAKKSVITLRMISHNPSKQIRIKLYLPMSTDNTDENKQIIVLFVNKGSSMYMVKSFLEENYPNAVLKGKISQLCIADDDGDIDEDFPPINNNQDITTLGVQNFWIDRIFENKKKPSIIYEMQVTCNDKHKDTMKERLISQANTNTIEEYDNNNNNNNGGCCWCCFGRNEYDSDDEEYERDL